jgi:hypothetical protein
MAEARIEHVIDCTEDTLWKVHFDPEFNRELFLKALAFEGWNQVSFDDKGDRIERVVDIVPRLGDLPGPLKKLAEGGAGYRERDSFDKATKVMKVNIEPSALSGKLTISGQQRTESVGSGKCRRIYDFSVTAKVFGVGGMIENRIIADVRKSYDVAADFMNRWVHEKGLAGG